VLPCAPTPRGLPAPAGRRTSQMARRAQGCQPIIVAAIAALSPRSQEDQAQEPSFTSRGLGAAPIFASSSQRTRHRERNPRQACATFIHKASLILPRKSNLASKSVVERGARSQRPKSCRSESESSARYPPHEIGETRSGPGRRLAWPRCFSRTAHRAPPADCCRDCYKRSGCLSREQRANSEWNSGITIMFNLHGAAINRYPFQPAQKGERGPLSSARSRL
jgi:hypothetical protein